MKKILSILGIVALVLIIAAALTLFILDKPIPQGKSGPEAQKLAKKMLKAINFSDWEKTDYVHWIFKDDHEYWWDRKRQIVKVKWNDTEVYFHTPSQEGIALENGQMLQGEYNKEAVKKAIKFFNSDSFWLNGPAKVLEPGTELAVVEDEDGRKNLLVSFTEGGTTPGDSYLWILDENSLPIACRMWVKVQPVGGLKATWEDWKQLNSGAWIATHHQIGPISIHIHELSSEKFSLPPSVRNKDLFNNLPNN